MFWFVLILLLASESQAKLFNFAGLVRPQFRATVVEDGNGDSLLHKSLDTSTNNSSAGNFTDSFSGRAGDSQLESAARNNSGASSFTGRVTYGRFASPSQHPWLALVVFAGSSDGVSRYSCAGALISPWFALTSAHCFFTPNEGRFMRVSAVHLGKKENLLEYQINAQVEYSHLHEQFNLNSLANDIALMKLRQRAIPNSVGVSAIRLPPRSAVPSVLQYSTVTVAGVGKTESNYYSPRLLFVPMTINNDACRYQSYFNPDKHLCLEGNFRGNACQGDSGGPAVLWTERNGQRTHYAVGLVSYGPADDTCFMPAISICAATQAYLSWIQRITAGDPYLQYIDQQTGWN